MSYTGKLKNWAVKRFGQKEGAEYGFTRMFSANGYSYEDVEAYNKVVMTCWGDSAIIYNVMITNQSVTTSDFLFQIFDSDDVAVFQWKNTLSVGDNLVEFGGKVIQLDEGGYIKFGSELPDVEVLVNGYYTGGMADFQVRVAAVNAQVEYELSSIRVAGLDAQVEYLNNSARISALGAQIEYNGECAAMVWSLSTQAEFVETSQINVASLGCQVEYAGGGNPTYPLSDCLIAYYSLDSDVADNLGAYDGVNHGITFDTGLVSNAGVFDGDTAYLDCGSFLCPEAIQTLYLSLWVYPTSIASDFGILGQYDQQGTYKFALWWDGTDLNFLIGNPLSGEATISTTTFAANAWQHIVAIYTGANMYLYIDGSLEDSTAESKALGLGAYNCFIGTARFNGSSANAVNKSNNYFPGKIDEVCFSSVLNTGNVASLYNSGSGINYASTAALGVQF